MVHSKDLNFYVYSTPPRKIHGEVNDVINLMGIISDGLSAVYFPGILEPAKDWENIAVTPAYSTSLPQCQRAEDFRLLLLSVSHSAKAVFTISL